MERQHARPHVARLLCDVEVDRLAQLAEAAGKDGARDGHAGGVRRLRHVAVAHVRHDAPLLHRVLKNDHHTGDRIELTARFEQHVAHEAVQVGFAGEALEVAANHGVRLGEFGDALLGRVLAFAAHVVHETFTVPGSADDPRRSLKSRELRGVDGTMLARVVESHYADELTGDEDWHDGLSLGAHPLDARGTARS